MKPHVLENEGLNLSWMAFFGRPVIFVEQLALGIDLL